MHSSVTFEPMLLNTERIISCVKVAIYAELFNCIALHYYTGVPNKVASVCVVGVERGVDLFKLFWLSCTELD